MADLEDAFAEALKPAPVAEPAPDLEIDFDDDGSPWHTLCEIRGADRHGLLHIITVGFAAAGVTVHTARIETKAGVAIDRFEVTDTDGRKLDESQQQEARRAIWSGSAATPTSGGLARLRRRVRVRASGAGGGDAV
jgi:UTP:GlnB (protein PII) uridylyltransferase